MIGKQEELDGSTGGTSWGLYDISSFIIGLGESGYSLVSKTGLIYAFTQAKQMKQISNMFPSMKIFSYFLT